MIEVKLKQEEVSRIVTKLMLEWQNQKLVILNSPERKIHERLVEIFIKDLRIEDDLNKEVDQLLSKYEAQFASGELDRRKMFNIVKAQLVKERCLIL